MKGTSGHASYSWDYVTVWLRKLSVSPIVSLALVGTECAGDEVPVPGGNQEPGVDPQTSGITPALVIAPWARRGAVSHQVFDHTSVLKLIEWRWGLDPLTVRDEAANNLVEALDLGQPRYDVPDFDVPSGPFGLPCPLLELKDEISLANLAELAREHGWPILDEPDISVAAGAN